MKDYKEPQAYPTEFEYTTKIKVDSLSIKWDLFWGQYPYNEVMRANKALTTAAKKAIEKKKWNIFYAAQNKYAEYGAADSEPTWQFESLWNRVYGG